MFELFLLFIGTYCIAEIANGNPWEECEKLNKAASDDYDRRRREWRESGMTTAPPPPPPIEWRVR